METNLMLELCFSSLNLNLEKITKQMELLTSEMFGVVNWSAKIEKQLRDMNEILKLKK